MSTKPEILAMVRAEFHKGHALSAVLEGSCEHHQEHLEPFYDQ